jgi:hypothetical protein
MQALGVLHPNFFLSRGSRARGDIDQLQQHATVLIKQYGEERLCEDASGVAYTCPALIDPVKLREQLPVYFRAARQVAKDLYCAKRVSASDSEHEWSETREVSSDSEGGSDRSLVELQEDDSAVNARDDDPVDLVGSANEVDSDVEGEHQESLSDLTRFWRILGGAGSAQAESYAISRYSEWMKLAEVLVVMVAGSVEDERSFSHMNNIKSDKRNLLSHKLLQAALRVAVQTLFDHDIFPFDDALKVWLSETPRRERQSKKWLAGQKRKSLKSQVASMKSVVIAYWLQKSVEVRLTQA